MFCLHALAKKKIVSSQLNISDFLSISTPRAQVPKYRILFCLCSVMTTGIYNLISGKRENVSLTWDLILVDK